jgi:hypothetical protein
LRRLGGITRKGKGCDIGYAPAASSLRGSHQRGRMHRHSP